MQDDFGTLNYVNEYITSLFSNEPQNGNPENIYTFFLVIKYIYN